MLLDHSPGAPPVVVYSASDLAAASTCEFAMLRRLDVLLGRLDSVPDPEDAMLRRTARLGDEHEARALAEFRSRFGGRVVEIERPDYSVAGSIKQRADETLAALRSPAGDDATAVVFQGTFFDGRFLGFSDFLVRDTSDSGDRADGGQGSWEVYDTKLARHAKVTALLQLAAYAEQLQLAGIPTGPRVHLMLGDGTTSSHRLSDVLPVYRLRRARLQHIIDLRSGTLAAGESAVVEWRDPRFTACGRCAVCDEQVTMHRDLLLVAGLRLTQRAKLLEAGIGTIDALADSTGPVPGIAEEALVSLRQQAILQVGAEHGAGEGQDAPPAFAVFNPGGIDAIPAPDHGDIFFDFEGDPLYTEPDSPSQWGLDYLFGLVEADGAFRAFWAHDHEQERLALREFLAYVRERRQRYPGMHIYHYASYERTHLQSLCARYGEGEEELDDLLRSHVLVDLYPIVRASVRVASRSYSLKKLEPLYMGDRLRQSEVTTAGDSIIAYVTYRGLRDDGKTDEAAALLGEIADYNEYDCASTRALRDWLLSVRDSASANAPGAGEGLPALLVRRPGDAELEQPELGEPDPLFQDLMALAGERRNRSDDQAAVAMAAAAIDYHRREHKTFWWEHFSRLIAPLTEWADARDVLIVEQVRVVEDWHRPQRARTDRRILEVRGQLAPGSAPAPGGSPFLVYEPPFPPIPHNGDPGARIAHNRSSILEVLAPGQLLVQERLVPGGEPYDLLPMALTPGAPPNPGTQVTAIAEWGMAILNAPRDGSGRPLLPSDPALDILRRLPPRGVLEAEPRDTVAAIVGTLRGLDRSYLAVQGPPGTGKTYVGARVIATLVLDHGWRVGVVSQSHDVVEHLLDGIIAAGVPSDLVGKKPKPGGSVRPPSFSLVDPAEYPQFATRNSGGFVLGGTAWDFSNAARVPRGSLDLLVVDEAGQFSLASTIAASVAAQRLLLLGDPQQLPQVSQGTHPEPVDESALGWLSAGRDVLPADRGYFLAESWRMHPALCEPVSVLSYEGRLHSNEAVTTARMLEGVEPGLHAEPVAHDGNSTSSPEEASRVLELAGALVGRAWTCDGRTAPLTAAQLIVVAPYNAQVNLIRSLLDDAGLFEVRVGTVDRFQGQEAAVAIVSLAASSAADVPRGIGFLLLGNRLNVAISRAKWAAFLVYSPGLTDFLPNTPDGLAQLSAFVTLTTPGLP